MMNTTRQQLPDISKSVKRIKKKYNTISNPFYHIKPVYQEHNYREETIEQTQINELNENWHHDEALPNKKQLSIIELQV